MDSIKEVDTVGNDARLKTGLIFLFSILIFSLFLCSAVFAQDKNVSSVNDEILSPANEKFQPATDLVSPWRSSGCNFPHLIQESGCYEIPTGTWFKAHIMNLYNEDASLWYRFSTNPGDALFYGKNTKMGFLPFATSTYDREIVILRMVGESPHWYQVEINEDTQKTKFVLKSDAMMWVKSTWNHWLVKMEGFTLKNSDALLLDEPDGKVIEEASPIRFQNYTFIKADGDWAYVEAAQNLGRSKGIVYKGWIRFRKGREMLINPNRWVEFQKDLN